MGVRVRRGKDWRYQDQDGGEGSEGTIVAQAKGAVLVTWDGSQGLFRYRANTVGPVDLVAAGSVPPPPQGWLCVRPTGGIRSIPVVVRARSALQCQCCQTGLIGPHVHAKSFASVKGANVNAGDRLLVAATLEAVLVDEVKDDRITCIFPKQSFGVNDESNKRLRTHEGAAPVGIRAKPDDEGRESLCRLTSDGKGHGRKRRYMGGSHNKVWYRPEDLIFPECEKGTDINGHEELRMYSGHARTKREFVLLFGGSMDEAKKAWYEAMPTNGQSVASMNGDEIGGRFASCLRGHLLHARCLQRTLVSGQHCPAPGCTQQLWMPHVQPLPNEDEDDDACCSGGNSGHEAEALRTASELSGHITAVASNHGGLKDRSEVDSNLPGKNRLKMCPSCCSGPFANDYCSNMRSHHGECSKARVGHSIRSNYTPCRFRATATEIAERLTKLSDTKTVADILPRCSTHDVCVMFNGCMACGYLFTDTSWHSLPTWDPNAKVKLALDLKKSHAARLLAVQVRKEAAMLQFEREFL